MHYRLSTIPPFFFNLQCSKRLNRADNASRAASLGLEAHAWLQALTPSSTRTLHQRSLLLVKADAARASGRLDDAEAAYAALLKVQPELVPALLGLAEVHLARSEAVAAMALCERGAAQVAVDDAVSALLLSAQGWAQFQQGNTATAVATLRSALAAHTRNGTAEPSDDVLLYRLGCLLLQQATAAGDEALRAEAAKLLLQAAKLNPSSSAVFHFLGVHYAGVGAQERAQKCLEKAVALSPSNHEAGELLAQMYLRQGQAERAAQLCETITQAAGVGSGQWAWIRLGQHQLFTKNDPGAAVLSFQNALRSGAQVGERKSE